MNSLCSTSGFILRVQAYDLRGKRGAGSVSAAAVLL
jgi:hypothetical protein